MKIVRCLFAAGLFASPVASHAANMNMPGMDHMMMMGGPGTPADSAPASKAIRAANMKMHAAMTVPFTGDPDVDFVRSMIPHHQGAVDMAKIELEYGKDPEMRDLAETIIKAQDDEIVIMKAWLAKHGAK